MSAGVIAGSAAAGLALNNPAGSGGPPGPPGPPVAFGSPLQNFVKLVDGVAVTAARSDHRHTQFPTPGSYVVYAVDYDGLVVAPNDNTALPGYSEALATPALTMAAALAAALLTPFKTLERVGQLLPRHGNGANLVIMVKPRTAGATYRNIANTADQDGTYFNLTSGWASVVRRATGDFTNTTADKIKLGAQIVAGTNAAGYSAGATTTTLNLANVLTAAGAAPALAVEAAGICALSGKRVRFLETTPTVALRNICTGIYANLAADTIGLDSALPVVPAFVAPGNAGNDVFVIEEPAWTVGTDLSLAGVNGSSTIGVRTAGMRTTGATNIRGPGGHTYAFCESATSFQSIGPMILALTRSYVDELNGSINAGCGMRWGTTASFEFAAQLTIANCCGAGTGFNVVLGCQTAQALGQGSLIRVGFSVQGGGSASSPVTASGRISLGNNGSATFQPMRTTNNVANNSPIIFQNCTGGAVRGADVSGDATGTANACISIDGTGGSFSIDGVVSGQGGNSGVVLDLSNAVDCKVIAGRIAANTVAATLGEVRFPLGVISPSALALLGTTDVWDTNRNHLSGTTAITNGGNGVITPSVQRFIQGSSGTIPEFRAFRVAGANFTTGLAEATAFEGFAGISVTPSPGADSSYLGAVEGPAWIEFDAGPTLGAMAYLSAANAGMATDTAPATVYELGNVIAINGALGLVVLNPRLVPAAPAAGVDATYKWSGIATPVEGNPDMVADGGLASAGSGGGAYVPRACTLKNLRVNVAANTLVAGGDVIVFKNGAATALLVSYGIAATGVQTNLADEVDFNGTTDTLDIGVDSGGAGSLTFAATVDVAAPP